MTERSLQLFSDAKVQQEPCISIHNGVALFQHYSTDLSAYPVPLECGHLGIETRDLGHRVWYQARMAPVGRTGD